jgi:hypothetical protein
MLQRGFYSEWCVCSMEQVTIMQSLVGDTTATGLAIVVGVHFATNTLYVVPIHDSDGTV